MESSKDQIIAAIDTYVKDESAMITHIGTQGEYIYLRYYFYDEDGRRIECEEHCLPDRHRCKEKTKIFLNTPRKRLIE